MDCRNADRTEDERTFTWSRRAEQLDDPLYDDKASRGISVEELARMIETSAAARRKMRRGARFGRSSARQ